MSSERVEKARRGDPLFAAGARLALVMALLTIVVPLVALGPMSSAEQPTEKVDQPDAPAAKSDDASGGLSPAEREALQRRLQEKQEREAAGAKAGPPAKDDASGGLSPAEREALQRRLQEKQEREAAGAKAGPPAKESGKDPPTPPATTVR